MAGRFTFALLLLVLGQGIESASQGAKNPHVFGSYEVIDSTRIAGDTQVELRFSLLNPADQAVSVDKISLLSVRPAPANALPAPILLRPHKVQEINQQFMILTPEYESWQRGIQPFLRLEMHNGKGDRFSQTLPLTVGFREEK